MTSKLNKILLVFNIIFTSYIVLNLLNKLESIKNGQIFYTITSMDGFVSELLSLVFCLVIVAIFNLISNYENESYAPYHILIITISISLIIYLIIYSAGDISYKNLAYLIISSTLIKINNVFKNYSSPILFSVFKYFFIYILCLCIYLIVSVNFGDPSNPFPFKDINQSGIYDDTYISVIYLSVIGILLPISDLTGITNAIMKRYKSIG